MNTWDEAGSDPSEGSSRSALRGGAGNGSGSVGDGSGSVGDGPWLPWRVATERALYGADGADAAHADGTEGPEGPDGTKGSYASDGGRSDPATGFFEREAPAAHFRTSVHASPLFAVAVARLLCHVDAALGHPRELALVDVGAGRGELLTGVLDALPDEVSARVRPCAVERAPRPEGLDERVEWSHRLPGPGRLSGLLFANEWLDDVPLDVAEAGPDGVVRTVLVRPSDGAERLGEPVRGPDAEWLRRWWPPGPYAAGEQAGPVAEPGGFPVADRDSVTEAGTGTGPGLRGEDVGDRAEAGMRAESGPRGGAGMRAGFGGRPEAALRIEPAPEPGPGPRAGDSPDGPGSRREADVHSEAGGRAEATARPGTGARPEAVFRAEPGARAEIGRPRDEAWADAVRTLDRGLAVAVDYGHFRENRPPFGTLTGYLDGREARPVPDGSRDITAHVAIDACAAAGAQAAACAAIRHETRNAEPNRTARNGGTTRNGPYARSGQDGAENTESEEGRDSGAGCAAPAVRSQRDALHTLGIDGARPPLSLASSDPAAYVRQLASAGEAAELTARDGLGAFLWLVQPVGGVTSPFG